LAYVNPALAAGLWAGSGVDQQRQSVEDAGMYGTAQGDAAMTVGSLITAVTERVGLSWAMRYLPKGMANSLTTRVGDLLKAGFGEGSQEVAEQLSHNLTDKLLINPNQSMGDGVWDNGAAGFAVGLLVRGGQHVQHLQRDANDAVQENQALNTLVSITEKSSLFKQSPERFKDANDGSWLTSYKITDKALWEKAKNGEFNGFSIEGVFNLIETDNTLESDFEAILKEVELWRRNTERIRMFNDYPEAVSNNAKRGLELNEKNGNKCATRVGRLRATTLANRDTVSLEIIKRMYSYLSRAEVYYNESDTSACGTISFLMWGGKAGLRWTEAKLKELGEM